MSWSSWLFSAKRAWQRHSLRWVTIVTGLLICIGTAVFLWRMVPLASQEETVIVHYNIYLGIDAVRPVYWIFLLPLFWWSLTLFDIIVAYGLFRTDPHLSMSLIYLAFAWSVPWLVTLYYLTLVNV